MPRPTGRHHSRRRPARRVPDLLFGVVESAGWSTATRATTALRILSRPLTNAGYLRYFTRDVATPFDSITIEEAGHEANTQTSGCRSWGVGGLGG